MTDYTALIDQLADWKTTRSDAWEQLMAAGTDAIPALIDGLHHHANYSVRRDCVMLMEKLDDPRIDPALLYAMQHDTSRRVLDHCVKAIGNITDDAVIAVAVDLLMQGNVPAADRLRRGPQSHKAFALLMQGLNAATTREGREPFFSALMRLSSHHTFQQHLDWLKHPDPDFRFQAALAMDHRHNANKNLHETAYERLVALASSETDIKVLARMLLSIGYFLRHFDKRAFTLLTRFLSHTQQEVVDAATRALKAAGYAPENRQLQCSVCGKSQPERRVEQCHICDKPICQDHWYRDPMGHYAFCSNAHEQEFTKAQGYIYWK